MANGRTPLDEEGCEYGRNINMRVSHLESMERDRQQQSRELEQRLREVETSIAKQSGKYILLGMTLSAFVGAIINKVI